MATLNTGVVSVPRPRVVSPRARSWWRAGACAAGLTLAATAALAAERAGSPPLVAQAPGTPPIPGQPPPILPGAEPTFPREPDPTGIEVPDEVTVDQLKGQYGIGLGLLILGGIITAGALIALLLLLVRRPWTDAHSHPR